MIEQIPEGKKKPLRSGLLIVLISFAGVGSLLILLAGFFSALDFFERLNVKKDAEMTAFWENHRAEFNEMAESCDWRKDDKTYKYAFATEKCLGLAKKLNFNPFQLENSGPVTFISNMYKGYIYSKKELLPLYPDSDSVPEIKISPYSCVYRKINSNWYIERCNPHEH